MIDEKDLKKIKEALNSQELKKLTVILVNEALLSSTTITAPEIRLCLGTLQKLISDTKPTTKVKPNKIAE